MSLVQARTFLASSLISALAACAGSEASEPDTVGVELTADRSPLDRPRCEAAQPVEGSEITAYETEVIARLSGVAETAPGVRLSDRATVANRKVARAYLRSLFDELGLAPLEHEYGTGANVYAELRSTSEERETIVLGAHFDSVGRSPGANDNATGVALVLAVARQLSALPSRSKNVMFVLFDEEERGLIGSRAFATKLQRDQVVVHSVHTVDQMGWDQNGDRLIELERPDTGLADMYRAGVSELGVSIPISVTSTTSSDHSSFRPAFRATGITEGYRSGNTSPDYHRPSDTLDKVNFAYLLSTTTLVAHVLANQLH